MGLKVTETGLEQIRRVAAAETDGNLSAAVRVLLTEAIQARAAAQQRQRRRGA